MAEVKSSFVDGKAPEREVIWNDWLKALAVLKQLVGDVPAAWLSGSFLTSKQVPGDIDSLFIIDAVEYASAKARLSPEYLPILTALAGGNAAREVLGLNVDSYILEWDPKPTPAANSRDGYYLSRGYWDDLWVRVKDPNDSRLESIPRRGYLEVIIDGYK
ncbi:hypothetical protein AB0E52_10405 [Micrococcus luteus]